MKLFLANGEKCDTIKIYANERYRVALSKIHTRLLKWAGLALNQSRRSEYREETPEWLNNTAELFSTLKDFRRVMGLKEQDRVVSGKLSRKGNDGSIIDISIDKSIRNWQCGLCQMIDIQEDAVCEVLPVLLTAYVYNFPDNTLVHQFLERNLLEWGCKEDITEYIYGVTRYPNPNLDDAVGFELLMFEQATDSPENRKMVSQLSKRFRFMDFSSYSLKDDLAGPHIFLLPKSIRADFVKNCKRRKYESVGETVSYVRKCVEPPAGFDFYNAQTLLRILGYFYSSICKFTKRNGTQFAGKPNPLFCWILVNQAIHDNVELEQIWKNCNQHPEEVLHRYCDEIIRAGYTLG